ncbi:MAG TPA: NifU family protein [Blastocatellia bacterium]|nr:NifU family protein [Blastocatellia bacterium]
MFFDENQEITAAQVEAVLDRVRPALAAHSGNIELVCIEGPDIHVRLKGNCIGCPVSALTLKYSVERALREEIAGFGELITEAPN